MLFMVLTALMLTKTKTKLDVSFHGALVTVIRFILGMKPTGDQHALPVPGYLGIHLVVGASNMTDVNWLPSSKSWFSFGW